MTTARQVVDEMQEKMVLRAEQLVVNAHLGKADVEAQGKTQTSRAIEVARASHSLALFLNWLRYQAARDERRPTFWARKAQSRTLAEELAADLHWVRTEINAVLARQPDGAAAGAAEKSALEMRAVVLYLGYFRRALIAAHWLPTLPNVTAAPAEGGQGA